MDESAHIFRVSLASLAASRTADSSATVVVSAIHGDAAYPMIATAVFNGSTWSLNTYTLDGIFHQSLGTDLASLTGLAEKPDSSLVMAGYDSDSNGKLLTFSYDGGETDESGIYYYTTLASETTLPGESGGNVFLAQLLVGDATQ